MPRAAYSLATLLKQINAKFPYRDKASDGGIGDTRHSTLISDHNPDQWGVYHAYDFDHDPDSNGLDCRILWRELLASRDTRIKYVIFNRVIWSPLRGSLPYSGTNPHTLHLHLSVLSGALGDDARQWGIPSLGIPTTIHQWTDGTYCKKGDRSDRVWVLQRHMTAFYPGYNQYEPTGFYGDATTAGIREFQDRVGITGTDADGTIVGPSTMRQLIQRGFRP